MALVGTAIAGCGSSSRSEGTSVNVATADSARESSPYVEVLVEFRDAVLEEKTYDAYGFAEYMPSTQRAAIDAFCFVADRVLKGPEASGIGDPADLIRRITRKAESDLKSERDIVAPRPARRAIAKLQAILELESLDGDLAGSYVKACY
jgi:hypothetical protein